MSNSDETHLKVKILALTYYDDRKSDNDVNNEGVIIHYLHPQTGETKTVVAPRGDLNDRGTNNGDLWFSLWSDPDTIVERYYVKHFNSYKEILGRQPDLQSKPGGHPPELDAHRSSVHMVFSEPYPTMPL